MGTNRAPDENLYGKRNGGNTRRRVNGRACHRRWRESTSPALVRVGPIGLFVDGSCMLAERERLCRNFTDGKSLPMPMHRAWLAEPTDAQQRRQ